MQHPPNFWTRLGVHAFFQGTGRSYWPARIDDRLLSSR